MSKGEAVYLLISILFNESDEWFGAWLSHTISAIDDVRVLLVVASNTASQKWGYEQTSRGLPPLPPHIRLMFSPPRLKTKVGQSLLEGHLGNVLVGAEMETPTHVVFMASNCAWLKKLNQRSMSDVLASFKLLRVKPLVPKRRYWDMMVLRDASFMAWNAEMLQEPASVCKTQVEGLTLRYEDYLRALKNFPKDGGATCLLPCENPRFPLEEFALSAALWKEKSTVTHICKNYLHTEPSEKTLLRVRDGEKHTLLFKRVPRETNSALFEFAKAAFYPPQELGLQLLLEEEEEEAGSGEESTKIRSKVGGGRAKTLRTSFSSLSIASSKFLSTALKADSPLDNCTCRKHS